MSDLVKALEWHNFDAWTWWAEAVCGTYHVEERNGGWRVELRFHDARRIITETDGFDGAIVAAQSDYTARILAALDLTAIEAMDAEVERLRDALKFYADPSAWNQKPVETVETVIGTAYRNEAAEMQKDRGAIARAAMKEADNARLVRLVEAEDRA